jgi:SH3 domain-containing YSC84-like protein 1
MEKICCNVRLGEVVLSLLILVAALFGVVRPATADDAQDTQQLVEKARLAFEAFVADKDMGSPLKALLKKGRGVLIYPQVLRGAFVFGVSGGSGVFLAYDAKTTKWGGPAFYTIGEASFGLQAGGDASEVVLVALTERGMTSLLATSAKLGADVGLALGPFGAGAEAATANLSADIISYSRSKGLYAGISLEGAVVGSRGSLNKAYYGKEVSPADILLHRTVSNAQAASLLSAVKRAAGK